jgi:hypothetical protein
MNTKEPEWVIKYNEGKTSAMLTDKMQKQLNEKLLKLIESAFVAGRSKTSWEQFKKDNNLG